MKIECGKDNRNTIQTMHISVLNVQMNGPLLKKRFQNLRIEWLLYTNSSHMRNIGCFKLNRLNY